MRIRIDKYPVLLLSLLALFISCEKDLVDPEPVESRTIHYSAVVSEGSETRATLNGSSQYVFEAGDQLYVENTDAGNAGKVYGLLTLVSGAGERSAVFEGDLTCDNEYIPLSSTQLSATLIGASEHSIHHFTNGKLNAARSYPTNEYATSLADAVSKYSDFTASSTYGAHSFTLSQQSAFLVFNVKFLATDVSTGTSVIASIKNDINDTNVTLRSGSVSATSLGEDHTQVAFVAAFPGGTTSLSDAALSVAWGANPERVLVLSDATLAANNYYTVTRSTFTYNGFRIRPATNETTTVTFKYNYTNDGIEYSTDEGVTWTHYTSGAVTLPADGICVRGTRVNYQNVNGTTPGDNPLFTATKKVYIAGNIMTLLADEVNLSENAFQGTFSKRNTDIGYIDINPSDPLILPNMTLAANCYSQMFMRCTGLTSLPDNLLPATSLADNCYSQMFQGCTGLTRTPNLPATTLASSCYQAMFKGCRNLETASPIPASTLEDKSCKQMFVGCTNLTTAPSMTITALNGTENCSEMFGGELTINGFKYSVTNGCTNLENISNIHLNAEELTPSCYYAMFMGSGVKTVPDGFLPAEDLSVACYMQMFLSCKQLTHVPTNLLPASSLMNGCYANMFRGCSNLVDPPDLDAITPVPACYFGMFRECTSLTHIKCLIVLQTSQQGKTRPGDITDTAFPTPSVVENWTINVWTVFNKWINDASNVNTGELKYNSAMPTPDAVYKNGDDVGKVPALWHRTPVTP